MGVIGKPIDRKDGRLKVTGGATYAAEFAMPGLVHAVLVQSTIAAGEIDSIDLSDAAGMRGVLKIVTPANALKLQKPTAAQGVPGPLLQDRGVAYNGSHVAVVVADTLERAQDAASRVKITYRQDEARPVMDSIAGAYVPKHFRNGARSPDSRRGDPDGAFDSAPVKVEQTYTTPVEHHNPMEPHATIAAWSAGADGPELTVWHSTQGIVGAQQTLAQLFGLKPAQVRVIDPYLGGGFGCKGNTWPPAALAAMAAKMVGRPVKLVLSREQMFTSNGYRPLTIQKLRIAAEADGRITSMRHDGYTQMSLGDFGEFAEPVALATELLYDVPHLAVSHRLVAVHQGLPTYMRAPGESSGNFALESAMDEMAVALNMDPLDLRLKNYAERDLHQDKPFSAKNLRHCYLRGSELFGWSKRPSAPRALRDGNVLVGWGMATSTYPANNLPAHARVRLAADGSVVVQAASQDIGTGTYTVMAQVAADTLGLPVSRVRVELGDSAFPPAPVSGGSMTVASLGPAVLKAAQQVRDRLLDLAAQRWPGTSLDTLNLRNGVVSGPAGRVGVGELLAGQGTLEITAAAAPSEEKKRYSTHSFGAQFCEVRVDPDFGTVRVSRWVGVFDVGRVLNAKTGRSQALGGITFGIGMALLEETHVDPKLGRIVNANIAEYLVPVNADVPELTVELLDGSDPIVDPLGARGLGELPMVGVAAAIANAVYHATGKRVRRLPIRIEDVLA
jgi:xanthine dehydrogenase YagR molybdenum-binding subunit